MTNSEGNRFRDLDASWISLAILCLVAVAYLAIRLPMVEAFVGVVGQSPLLWLAQQAGEAWTAYDWPTGTRNLGKSLPVQAYHLAELLGVSSIRIMQAYIIVEVAVGLAAFRWAARRLAPEIGESGAVAIALIGALSALGFANLARFAHPFQWGLYYTFAESFRLVGVVGLGLGRWKVGFFALSAAVVVHPTVGGYGLLAALPVLLVQHRRAVLRNEVWVPAIIAGSGAALWLLVSLGGVTMTSGAIAVEDWYSFTRLFNSHWYPVHVGVFGSLGYMHALPFLALMALGLKGLAEFPGTPHLRRYLGGVLAVSLVLTAVGLIVSETTWRPVLTKLALHRTSELTVGIALILGVALLWKDLREGNAARRGLAVVILAAPFFAAREAVLPILPVLIRAAPWAWPRTTLARIVATGWAIIAVLAVALMLAMPELSLRHRAVSGWDAWANLARLYTPVVVGLVFVVVLAGRMRGVATLAILVMLAAMALKAEDIRQAGLRTPQAAAWRDVLAVLAERTPADALIMPDPSQALGLRDLAHRASFGTMHEWLMSAWQYDSDAALFAEGVRRFSIYGVDPAPYLRAPNTRWQAAHALSSEIGRRHHAADEAFFRAVRREWGVDYVIRRKIADARPLSFEGIHADQFFEVLRLDGPEPATTPIP